MTDRKKRVMNTPKSWIDQMIPEYTEMKLIPVQHNLSTDYGLIPCVSLFPVYYMTTSVHDQTVYGCDVKPLEITPCHVHESHCSFSYEHSFINPVVNHIVNVTIYGVK